MRSRETTQDEASGDVALATASRPGAVAHIPTSKLLALQRSIGNAAVARGVRGGLIRPPAARLRLARQFDKPAAWKDAAGASKALDEYTALAPAARKAAVVASYRKNLVQVLRELSPADQVQKYRVALQEILRWAQEEETRASSGQTDDQMATVQKDFLRKRAQDAAAAAAAAKGPGAPPPTAADVEAERKKQVASTSVKPAGPSGWDAMSPAQQTGWTDRANAAIAKVVTLAQAKHPEIGLTAARFRVAFRDVEKRGATVLAFAEDLPAGGKRAAVGFAFVTAAELNPAYVMDIVVHEIRGHTEYGVYGTEYHLALYDLAMAKTPGYVKPAADTPGRRTETDAYAYQETEIYAVLRSMPYRTAPTAADAGKVSTLDTQKIVTYRVGLMKQQWAPTLIVAILRGYRWRLVLDPRIKAAALNAFDTAVRTTFDPATEAAVKK